MDEDILRRSRERIGEADRAMARLFSERMAAVREIAAYKRARGLPVLDAAREKEVIERNLALIGEEALRGPYVEFIQALMDVSKRYQRRLLEGMRVACDGAAGDAARIAARRIFPDGAAVPCADARAAYESVERGDCDACVLPVGQGGEADRVSDLMLAGSLHLTGVYALPPASRTGRDGGEPGAARFGVFAREENTLARGPTGGFILLFTPDPRAGGPAAAENVIARHGFALRALRARPIKDQPGGRYLLAEVAGDDRSEAGRRMLAELATCCGALKLAGRFGPEVVLEEAQP